MRMKMIVVKDQIAQFVLTFGELREDMHEEWPYERTASTACYRSIHGATDMGAAMLAIEKIRDEVAEQSLPKEIRVIFVRGNEPLNTPVDEP